jgi:hypothetical protein
VAPETLNPLISAGAGLLGALIGAGATLFGQWRQRISGQESEIEREQREATRREKEAKDERVRKAVEACDALLFQIAGLARQLAWPRDRQANFPKRAEPLLAELSSHSVFLPDILRGRVDEAAQIIGASSALAPDSGSNAPEQFHYQTMGSIAESAQRDAHLALAAWLQDQVLPPRSREMRENVAAYKGYVAFMDDLFSDQDDDWYDVVRRDFFRVHPELRPPEEQTS